MEEKQKVPGNFLFLVRLFKFEKRSRPLPSLEKFLNISGVYFPHILNEIVRFEIVNYIYSSTGISMAQTGI